MFHQHRQAINVPPNRLLIRLPIQQLLLENVYSIYSFKEILKRSLKFFLFVCVFNLFI